MLSLLFWREIDFSGLERLAVDAVELVDGDEFKSLGVQLGGYLLKCVGGHVVEIVHEDYLAAGRGVDNR